MEMQLHPDDREKVQEILSVLNREEKFLLTTHRNLDGDAIGSELALYDMLRAMGKEVVIVNQDRTPAIYRFLPYTRKVKLCGEVVDAEIKPDVSIVIDCGSPERTGKVFSLIKKAEFIINIDHHFSNSGFANINWINHRFSATGEMVYFILSFDGRTLTKKEANCLYTAVLTDTGGFVHNISQHTMNVVQNLVASGAEPEEIARKVYCERPLRSVKLLSSSLNSLQFNRQEKVCWMKVDKDMYRSTGTKEEDTEGFIDILIKIKEAGIVFLLKEGKDRIKASLRSKGNFDVERIAAEFGGGGHKKAAGCYFENVTIEQAEKKILAAIRRSTS